MDDRRPALCGLPFVGLIEVVEVHGPKESMPAHTRAIQRASTRSGVARVVETLPTKRLLLRWATEADVLAIAQAAETTNTDRISAGIARQTAFLASHGYGLWVLVPRGTDRVLGWCGLKPGEDPWNPEIMFGVERASRGVGLASEAARAVIDHAFTLPGIESVWGATTPENQASAAVMKRAGMSFEEEKILDGIPSMLFRVGRRPVS